MRWARKIRSTAYAVHSCTSRRADLAPNPEPRIGGATEAGRVNVDFSESTYKTSMPPTHVAIQKSKSKRTQHSQKQHGRKRSATRYLVAANAKTVKEHEAELEKERLEREALERAILEAERERKAEDSRQRDRADRDREARERECMTREDIAVAMGDEDRRRSNSDRRDRVRPSSRPTMR